MVVVAMGTAVVAAEATAVAVETAEEVGVLVGSNVKRSSPAPWPSYTSWGGEFGVTRERIRQIEANALRKLRHPKHSMQLREFLP